MGRGTNKRGSLEFEMLSGDLLEFQPRGTEIGTPPANDFLLQQTTIGTDKRIWRLKENIIKIASL
jgi:hypothetical protein